MTSRERVLCALNHEMPDRLPIDFGGTRVTGITASAYHALKRHLGLCSPIRVFDVHTMLAEVEPEVRSRLGGDVAYLCSRAVVFGITNENWKPWRLFDGTPVEVPGGFEPRTDAEGNLIIHRHGKPLARMPKDGHYFDLIEQPGAAYVDPEKFEPAVLGREDLEHYRVQAQNLYDHTELAVVAPLGPPEQLFAGMGWRDFAGWMITLATEPDYVRALYDKLLAAWLENLARFADVVGDRVHVIQICDDLGTQESLLISVKMFRDLVLPYYQRGFDWIHQNTKWKVFFHSDGAVYPMIPSLIQMGVDILNPVQISAAGMSPERLKREFGSRLVFWGGGIDSQHTLPFASPVEVAREAEENARILGSGGGYVFAGVHNIQAGVPPENVVAMFQAAANVRFE